METDQYSLKIAIMELFRLDPVEDIEEEIQKVIDMCDAKTFEETIAAISQSSSAYQVGKIERIFNQRLVVLHLQYEDEDENEDEGDWELFIAVGLRFENDDPEIQLMDKQLWTCWESIDKIEYNFMKCPYCPPNTDLADMDMGYYPSHFNFAMNHMELYHGDEDFSDILTLLRRYQFD